MLKSQILFNEEEKTDALLADQMSTLHTSFCALAMSCSKMGLFAIQGTNLYNENKFVKKMVDISLALKVRRKEEKNRQPSLRKT